VPFILLFKSTIKGPWYLKGQCHAIWHLYRNLENYLKVLKLIPATWRYGWQGWKWIEILKNWPVFSNFDAMSSKNAQEIYYGCCPL